LAPCKPLDVTSPAARDVTVSLASRAVLRIRELDATVDGQLWRTVMAEPGTVGNELPGVPAGPGSYPGSFSVVDPSTAVFVGDTPPATGQTTMIATNGGATLKTTGEIAGAWQTFDAAFVSTSLGWVLTVDVNRHIVIVATIDGGYHWSQQLAVTP